MRASWGIDGNFDDRRNLLSVLSGSSSIPGRVPHPGISSREMFETISAQSKKRRANLPPERGSGADAKLAEMMDIDTDCELLDPVKLNMYEVANPIRKNSQIPGHKLKRRLDKSIQSKLINHPL